MARHFAGGKLVLASHNPGKVREIQDLLAPYGTDVVSAGALGLPEPDETEDSFIGNAKLKAMAATKASGLPALADDSGMAVNALDGAPGIYSARWAGPSKDFGMAMAKVLKLLQPAADRAAEFVCALALAWPDGHCECFEGRIAGTIIDAPRGSKGFGYDPIFLPPPELQGGGKLTFGEMEAEAKHAISHRALAFHQLVEACFGGK